MIRGRGKQRKLAARFQADGWTRIKRKVARIFRGVGANLVQIRTLLGPAIAALQTPPRREDLVLSGPTDEGDTHDRG